MPSPFFVLALLAAPTPITMHADQALRGVPAQLVGVNFTSYGKSGTDVTSWEPCCLTPAAGLDQPVALWRTPGGILGDFFHINGLYDNSSLGNSPNGVDMVHFINVADRLKGGLLHILNINATDQELQNEIEYLNSPVPANPGAGWTKTSYRFDAAAPTGYFAWLRAQHGHPAPAGVRYVEIGNEVWNFYNDTDTRCNHVATCYGTVAAALSKKLKAIDPTLQVGVSILNEGQSANSGYLAPDIYKGFVAAGIAPDFVFDHGYYNCNYGAENAAEASYHTTFGDFVQQAGATTRSQLVTAFGSCGNGIGMFFDEFGPQACANNADAFEAFGYWATAAVAHVYAAGLHSGYTNLSYYDWNDGADTGQDGLVWNNGTKDIVDANYWGVWFASKLVAGGVSEVSVTGQPAAMRVFAVESDSKLRVLLVNTDAANSQSLALTVSGRTTTASRAYQMDRSYVTAISASGVPAHRAGVPQTAPGAVSIDVSNLTAAPLSTTLVEFDLAAGSAPTAPAATTGGCVGMIPDGGSDAGSDGGSDAGRDAGSDAGSDAGQPAGSDAGSATVASSGSSCASSGLGALPTFLLGLAPLLRRRARARKA
jgi:hypothetical protein